MGLFWDFHCYPKENLQLFALESSSSIQAMETACQPLNSLDRHEGGADIPCDCMALSLPCCGDSFWLIFVVLVFFKELTTYNSPKSQLAIMTTPAWGVRAVKVLPVVPPPGHKLGSVLP